MTWKRRGRAARSQRCGGAGAQLEREQEQAVCSQAWDLMGVKSGRQQRSGETARKDYTGAAMAREAGLVELSRRLSRRRSQPRTGRRAPAAEAATGSCQRRALT